MSSLEVSAAYERSGFVHEAGQLFQSLDGRYNSKIAALGKNVKPALDGFQHRVIGHFAG